MAAAPVRRSTIAALTCGVLLTLGLTRVADLWWWRAETVHTAEARASNLSAILAEYVHESFAAGDAKRGMEAFLGRKG